MQEKRKGCDSGNPRNVATLLSSWFGAMLAMSMTRSLNVKYAESTIVKIPSSARPRNRIVMFAIAEHFFDIVERTVSLGVKRYDQKKFSSSSSSSFVCFLSSSFFSFSSSLSFSFFLSFSFSFSLSSMPLSSFSASDTFRHICKCSFLFLFLSSKSKATESPCSHSSRTDLSKSAYPFSDRVTSIDCPTAMEMDAPTLRYASSSLILISCFFLNNSLTSSVSRITIRDLVSIFVLSSSSI